MANYRAIATGNWSNGATWAGGAVPPNGQGHNIYSNNFTVTIDTNVDVALLTNASVSASFVGGGTSAAAGGGFDVSGSGFTITANLSSYSNPARSTVLVTSGAGASSVFNGNITGFQNITNRGTLTNSGAGNLSINGNITATGSGGYYIIAVFSSAGQLTINGNISCIDGGNTASTLGSNASPAVFIHGSASLIVNNGTITGGASGSSTSQTGVYSTTNVSLTFNNCIINAGLASPSVVSTASSALFFNSCVFIASNGVSAISASVVNAYGTFVYSANGTNPLGGARLILGTTPTNAYTQFALNGINSNSFVRFYTADNNLGQANPTDVRSGVSYASGNLTGRLTVPARGSVSLNVNYGPSMAFTATCAGTTATATLAYSYPLVVGDTITVTGASNTEWNSTYTIASVVSGTSVTFIVPATHSASAGTGALMQTTGTAVLDPAAVASAVWGAATRTLTAGGGISASDVWDYATRTLTSVSGPTAVQIRQEMDSNSTKLANLDATVSSRLAPSGTLAVVTTLTNAPAVPSAAAIATQVRTELGAELGRLDANISSRLAPSGTLATVTTLTNAPNVPTAAAIAAQVRTELASELAKMDAAVSTRATPANIPSADITAIKAKTDAVNVERINNTATTAIVGNLLAQANS